MTELLSGSDKTDLERIIEKYTSLQADQERLAMIFFDRVEKLLKGSETFKIDNELKIEMADRALAKQAPFHNSKNNMADALLYFGAVEHVKKKTEIATDLIFVTSNHKEFSDPNDFAKLHPDLHKGNVHFYNNLAQALKMRKEAIDLLDEYYEYQFWDWIEGEAEIVRGK
ncbi:PIN domain-containing protein [Chitinophaga sp. RCC_12]|uniref:PIN domain-containing protein n=1 Tax=Chitinophaga sp. RCC_12 TaxID=3239226 RepID=UPI003526904B